jgi:hypothetical protein
MKIELNEVEVEFFDYMVGGNLPTDNHNALRILLLEADINKSWDDCYKTYVDYERRWFNVTWNEFMVIPHDMKITAGMVYAA